MPDNPPIDWYKNLPVDEQYKLLVDTMLESAATTIPKRPQAQKKSYISPETWQLIEDYRSVRGTRQHTWAQERDKAR
eukprot:4800710-Karenia_brevis.AAC.1